MKPTLAELQAYLDSEFIPPTQQPDNTPTPPTHDHIHNFSDLDWQTECEPPYPSHPSLTKLYYLLTLTAQTIVANYPHNNHDILNPTHYIAWAEIPNPTLH